MAKIYPSIETAKKSDKIYKKTVLRTRRKPEKQTSKKKKKKKDKVTEETIKQNAVEQHL